MKRKSLRYISFILVFSLVLVCGVSATTCEEDTIRLNDLTELELLGAAQKGALDAFFQVKNIIAFNEETNKYPDAFGGVYINSNNELVFQIRGGDQELINSLSNMVDADSPVSYSNCKYSLNELYDISETFLSEIGLKFPAYVLFDEENNRVVIEFAKTVESLARYLNDKIQSENLPIRIKIKLESDVTVNNMSRSIQIENYTDNTDMVNPATTFASIALTGGSTLYKKAIKDGTEQYIEWGTLGFSGTYGGQTAY